MINYERLTIWHYRFKSATDAHIYTTSFSFYDIFLHRRERVRNWCNAVTPLPIFFLCKLSLPKKQGFFKITLILSVIKMAQPFPINIHYISMSICIWIYNALWLRRRRKKLFCKGFNGKKRNKMIKRIVSCKKGINFLCKLLKGSVFFC